MLQIYDKLKSSSLLAVAAAGGLAVAPVAMADGICSGEAGYGNGLVEYVSQAEICVNQTNAVATEIAESVAQDINRARIALGLPELNRRDGLDMASQAHALDMAKHDYVAHTDMQGRDHLYRIGAFDRSVLVGDFGANVVKVPASFSAGRIFNTMGKGEENALNLVRESFTDMGVGIAEADGAYYVVVTFADVEGELETALPLSPQSQQSLAASLEDRSLRAVKWGLSDAQTGEAYRQTFSSRLSPRRLDAGRDAAVYVIAVAGAEQVTLKGPLVAGR
jgi:uncharacterized protein YkwD